MCYIPSVALWQSQQVHMTAYTHIKACNSVYTRAYIHPHIVYVHTHIVLCQVTWEEDVVWV